MGAMDADQQGRTAVVTGASSGIGAASARALAREGFHVVCAARRTDRIEALAAEIGGTAITCDVTDADSVAALAEAVATCHVLVNNAGGAFGSDRVDEADLDDWRRMYEINVIGLVQVTKALLPALRASGDALIVNVGSTAGRWAYEGGAGYTAAKHALKVVTETLRLELNGEPIRISEVAPGMVPHRRVRPRALRWRPGAGRTRCTPASTSRCSPRTSPTRSPGSRPGPPTSTSTSSSSSPAPKPRHTRCTAPELCQTSAA